MHSVAFTRPPLCVPGEKGEVITWKKKCLQAASPGDEAFRVEQAESQDDIMECNTSVLGCSISDSCGREQEQMLASTSEVLTSFVFCENPVSLQYDCGSFETLVF